VKDSVTDKSCEIRHAGCLFSPATHVILIIIMNETEEGKEEDYGVRQATRAYEIIHHTSKMVLCLWETWRRAGERKTKGSMKSQRRTNG
jgi:hypothetical protein